VMAENWRDYPRAVSTGRWVLTALGATRRRVVLPLVPLLLL
jgi:hypothetical protein